MTTSQFGEITSKKKRVKSLNGSSDGQVAMGADVVMELENEAMRFEWYSTHQTKKDKKKNETGSFSPWAEEIQ